MKYALISQRQMIEIESAFKTKRLFATVKDIETIDKALKILHLLKFSDAVEITGAELAKPEPKLTDAGADTNITRGLEPKGSGMVTLNQPEQNPVAYLCENAVGYKYFRWKNVNIEINIITAISIKREFLIKKLP